MAKTEDVLNVISLIEKFLPVVGTLVGDLKGLISGASGKSVDQILDDADANWQSVIDTAKKQLSSAAGGGGV